VGRREGGKDQKCGHEKNHEGGDSLSILNDGCKREVGRAHCSAKNVRLRGPNRKSRVKKKKIKRRKVVIEEGEKKKKERFAAELRLCVNLRFLWVKKSSPESGPGYIREKNRLRECKIKTGGGRGTKTKVDAHLTQAGKESKRGPSVLPFEEFGEHVTDE